jgi:hypothetical protein
MKLRKIPLQPSLIVEGYICPFDPEDNVVLDINWTYEDHKLPRHEDFLKSRSLGRPYTTWSKALLASATQVA